MHTDVKNAARGAVREIADLLDAVDAKELEAFAGQFRGDGRVFIAGAGRTGLVMRSFAMRLMHMGKRVHMVGDTTTPSAAAGDLLLVGSCSGETGTLLPILRKAKTIGMRTALVTGAEESSMSALADTKLVIPAPSPKRQDGGGRTSAQPMGNLFEQALLVTLDCVVMTLMQRENIDATAMFARHANLE